MQRFVGLSLTTPDTLKQYHRQRTHISLGMKKHYTKKCVTLPSKLEEDETKTKVCVCVHTRACASSVFGVPLCSALMKEFMFNSRPHRHVLTLLQHYISTSSHTFLPKSESIYCLSSSLTKNIHQSQKSITGNGAVLIRPSKC